MNQHNPPPQGEPNWPFWWQRRCDGGKAFAAIGYSKTRIIENSWDIQTYSYVVVPQ